MYILTNSFTGINRKAIRDKDVLTFSVENGYVRAELFDGDEPLARYVDNKQAEQELHRLLKAVSNPLRRLYPLYTMPDK